MADITSITIENDCLSGDVYTIDTVQWVSMLEGKTYDITCSSNCDVAKGQTRTFDITSFTVSVGDDCSPPNSLPPGVTFIPNELTTVFAPELSTYEETSTIVFETTLSSTAADTTVSRKIPTATTDLLQTNAESTKTKIPNTETSQSKEILMGTNTTISLTSELETITLLTESDSSRNARTGNAMMDDPNNSQVWVQNTETSQSIEALMDTNSLAITSELATITLLTESDGSMNARTGRATMDDPTNSQIWTHETTVSPAAMAKDTFTQMEMSSEVLPTLQGSTMSIHTKTTILFETTSIEVEQTTNERQSTLTPASECLPPPNIDNTVKSSSDYYIGAIVTYSCIDGYAFSDGRENVVSVCNVFGIWVGKPEPCVRAVLLCPAPPVIDHATIKGLSRTLGSVIQYVCETGYTTENDQHTTNVTCRHMVWVGTPKYCKADECTAPPQPENADMTISGVQYGDHISVQCHLGYHFDDYTKIRTAVCLENQRWSSHIIGCKEFTCSSPELSAPKDTRETNLCTAGSRNDDGIAISTRECSSRGVWHSEFSECSEQKCLPVPYLKSAIGSTDTKHKSYISCRVGMRFIDGDAAKAFDCHNPIANLGRSPNVCLDITCPPSPDPYLTIKNSSLAVYGTAVEYKCPYGFWFQDGNLTKTISCSQSGIWNDDVSNCTQTHCTDVYTLGNVMITGEADDIVGSVVNISCPLGSRFIDGKTEKNIVCLLNGQWSSLVSDCSGKRCQPVPTIQNASPDTYLTPHEVTVTYQCDLGYSFPDGSKVESIMCLTSGDWNQTLDDCTIDHCPPLPDTQNGIVNSTDTEYATVVNITCNDGYLFPSGTRWHTTECQLGKIWSEYFTECEPVRCSYPSEVDNGRVELNGQQYQDTATTWCNEGYFTENKTISATSVCNVNAKWTPSVKNCTEILCEAVPTWLNAKFNTTSNHFKTYINMTCDDGYQYTNGHKTIFSSCLHSGKWDPPFEDCKATQIGKTQLPSTEAPQAVNIGAVTIGIVGAAMAIIVIADLLTLSRDIQQLKLNLRHLLPKAKDPSKLVLPKIKITRAKDIKHRGGSMMDYRRGSVPGMLGAKRR